MIIKMNTEKKQNIYKILMLVILTAFITFMVTSLILYKTGMISGSINEKYVMVTGENSTLGIDLSRIRQIIDKYYMGEINEQDLREGAIKGYVEGLGDEYTEYFTAQELEDFYADALGSLDGVGIYMTQNLETEEIIVVSTIKESPAEAAGILSGDIITKVDGEECTGQELETVSNKVRGESGTQVELEINRNGEILNFTLTRTHVKVNHVEGKVIEENIGYIQVASFDEETGEEFEAKYQELKAQNIQSLIVDIRNNTGGIVDEALEIIDLFIPKDKTMLITIDKDNNEEEYKSKRDVVIDMPVVLLVNEYSASASEILAGALKDYGEATLVGTKTYGKGVIQELLQLTDGSGIKITTNEYYTPNHNKINKVGIEPNETVELPEEVEGILTEEQDTQLQRAIELLKNNE